MAAENWRTDRTLGELTVAAGAGWCQHQLVRMILAQTQQPLDDDQAIEAAIEKHIKFIASDQADFPPSSVRQVARQVNAKGGESFSIHKTQHNLSGVQGTLPEALSELISQYKKQGNTALAAFFQLFEQRLHSLKYMLRATNDSAFTLTGLKNSALGKRLLSLSGQDDEQGLTQTERLACAGLLADSRRSYDQARLLFATLLSLSLKQISPLQGQWHQVCSQDHTLLGQINCQLNQSCCLGRRVWDQMAQVEWVFDNVATQRLAQLQPGGSEYPLLKRIFHHLSAGRFSSRITLHFTAEPLLPTAITSSGKGPKLGYNALLSGEVKQLKALSFNLIYQEPNNA